MKFLKLTVSLVLLSGVPSFGVYAVLHCYFNMDPLYIHLINGLLMFVLGGTLIAINNSKGDQKESMDDLSS